MNTFTLLIVIALLFVLLETPLFTIIAALSIICFYFVDQDFIALQTILIEMNRLASMPVLMALPMFTLVGALLTETEAPRRIMNFIRAILGWMPGGLAIAALCSCAFFTALTGASGVTLVALGSLLYPILRQHQYPEHFTLGLLTTAGSRGLMFPPSLPVILYGVVSQTDIAMIFKAALVPGVLVIVILSIYAALHPYLRRSEGGEVPTLETISWQRIKQTFREGLWDWPIIVIILVGVYGGLVTIAEVAALVLVYVIIVECFVLKEIQFFKQLPGILIESAVLTGAIIVILAFALGFTGYLVDAQIPGRILQFLTQLTESRYVFLAGLNLFLLVVGCIMDIFSATIIIVPIMVPIALTYGIDPIHLCVIFLLNLEIGYSTPPVGINLFISSLKFEKPITVLYRASLPYLVLLLMALVLITYVPVISLFWVR